MNRLPALAAAAAAASAGCVQIDAQLPEICGSQQVTLHGAPNALAQGGSFTQEFDFVPQQADQLTTLALDSGSFTVQPPDAFAGVTALQIELVPPAGSSAPELQLASTAAPGSAVALGPDGADLLPYAGGRIRVSGSGSFTGDATLAVELCLAAGISKQFQIGH